MIETQTRASEKEIIGTSVGERRASEIGEENKREGSEKTFFGQATTLLIFIYTLFFIIKKNVKPTLFGAVFQ